MDSAGYIRLYICIYLATEKKKTKYLAIVTKEEEVMDLRASTGEHMGEMEEMR